jgi:hypothetical protein
MHGRASWSDKFVKHFGRAFHSISIAGCAVLIYTALVVMGAGCMLAHADRTQAHHDHSEGNSSPQNAFCAWACQAMSDVVAVAHPPVDVTLLVVEQQVSVPDSYFLSSASTVLHPRAPPSTTPFSRG